MVTREQLLSLISVRFLWKPRDIPLLSFLYLDKLLLSSYLLGEGSISTVHKCREALSCWCWKVFLSTG